MNKEEEVESANCKCGRRTGGGGRGWWKFKKASATELNCLHSIGFLHSNEYERCDGSGRELQNLSLSIPLKQTRTEKEMDVGAIGSKSDNFFSFSCDCFLLFCLFCHRSIPRSSFAHRIPWLFSSLFRVIASVFFLVFLILIYSRIIFCPSHLIPYHRRPFLGCISRFLWQLYMASCILSAFTLGVCSWFSISFHVVCI